MNDDMEALYYITGGLQPINQARRTIQDNLKEIKKYKINVGHHNIITETNECTICFWDRFTDGSITYAMT